MAVSPNPSEYNTISKYIPLIAQAAGLPERKVSACVRLITQGCTVPFIARYRKEATGSLDDAQILTITEEMDRIKKLEERRETILGSIRESGKLTPELETRLLSAKSLAALEDLYLPYRPRRKTRADIARERGLEPLADCILRQDPSLDLQKEAAGYINPEKGIESEKDAISGAQDIIASSLAEDPDIREHIRSLFHRSSLITSSAARGTGGDAGVYQGYVNHTEPANRAPSHRILALFRGEKEGLLSLNIGPDSESGIREMLRLQNIRPGPAAEIIQSAAADGYRRLLAPSLEREIRSELKEKADETAAAVFSQNVKGILLAPPIGRRVILAIDPGLRTGCKVVVLNPQGNILTTTTIYPHPPELRKDEAKKIIRDLCSEYHVEVIGVGDGTAGRETWQFITAMNLPESIRMVSVSEQGASIYSASAYAREELPDMDVSMRGAVSIGRRLLDPLAELVKIEPRSLGVGQYQHDVDSGLLEKRLEEVVVYAVHTVGVDLNTASVPLLSYVSGLSKRIASAIVSYRDTSGGFKNRNELKKVKGIGDKTFEQAAGFIRIYHGEEPLDGTGVHPERYDLIYRMAMDNGLDPGELIQNEEKIRAIALEKYISDSCGMPTLQDIRDELVRPGRDPRGEFRYTPYENQVTSIEDLKEGMILSGIVTNVTNFGAFVSLGLKENGLIHISELADFYVSDPSEVVRVSEQVQVRVIGVDIGKKRISLSMKEM